MKRGIPKLLHCLLRKNIYVKMLAGLLMVSLLGGTGCMNAKLNRMVDYINAKYSDDSFTFFQMSGGHLGSNEKKILVKSEKYPDAYIRVICTESGGQESFRDTYLGAKFEDETREYLKKAIAAEFGDNIYLEYQANDLACTENGSSETTFADYISTPTSYVAFAAVVPVEQADEKDVKKAIEKMFPDAALRGVICFVHEDIILTGEEGEKRAVEILDEDDCDHRLEFSKKTLDSFDSWEWR